MAKHYLACDLGAETGRLMLGSFEHDKMLLEEIHRFSNHPLQADGSLHWNIDHLFRELIEGLRKAAARKLPIASFSTDSWGVDYLLYDAQGKIISPTFHYRDVRCGQGVDKVLPRVEWKTIFAETGIQFMPINTLFQLGAESPARLDKTRWLLGIGDGFNYMLSGQPVAEESLASTTQLYNPVKRDWSDRLLKALGLRREIFPKIVPSGTVLGPLRTEMAEQTGLSGLQVVAGCSHDTGAAVAAVPATEGHWAYLSSGTWSLMGVERPEPVITDACRDMNFTNEIGYGRTIRLLKNIVGLWIVQECRRHWESEGQTYDYAALTHLAAAARPFGPLINPADPRFLSPGQMPEKIVEYCRETKQPEPQEPGMMIRCVLESLALLYRRTLKQLEQLTGQTIERLHIVGGGGKNELLNQLTANALQIPVVVGPTEATAYGNILVQAMALGDLPSLRAARQVIQTSEPIVTIEPTDPDLWKNTYDQFETLIALQ